jgi:hypothetical protein
MMTKNLVEVQSRTENNNPHKRSPGAVVFKDDDDGPSTAQTPSILGTNPFTKPASKSIAALWVKDILVFSILLGVLLMLLVVLGIIVWPPLLRYYRDGVFLSQRSTL